MTEKKKGNAALRLTAAVAAVLAALLAATAGYAVAKYVKESASSVLVGLDSFGVTSTMTYTDAGTTDDDDYAEAFDGSLGVMKFPSDGSGIAFTMHVANGGAVPVYCTLTLSGGYAFSLSEDEKNDWTQVDDGEIKTSGQIAAGTDKTLTFTVVRDTSYAFDPDGYYTGVDVYSRNLEITVAYEQAEEA